MDLSEVESPRSFSRPKGMRTIDVVMKVHAVKRDFEWALYPSVSYSLSLSFLLFFPVKMRGMKTVLWIFDGNMRSKE